MILDDAVATMLEMESYLPPHAGSTVNSTLPEQEQVGVAGVDTVDNITQLQQVVEKLGRWRNSSRRIL